MAQLKWTTPDPKADARAVSRLVETAEPHRLTGVSIETLVDGWGVYQDDTRAKYAALVVAAPELLAALVELRDSPYFERLSPAKQDTIYAAIDKAEGR